MKPLTIKAQEMQEGDEFVHGGIFKSADYITVNGCSVTITTDCESEIVMKLNEKIDIQRMY